MLKTVKEFVTAVQTGDQAKLAALIHPAIKWHQPGNNRISGIKTPNADVFQMVGSMFEISQGSLALTDIKFVAANGNTAAYLLHWKAQRPGAVLDLENIDVYTVENGQIIEAKIYSEDVVEENHFWGKWIPPRVLT